MEGLARLLDSSIRLPGGFRIGLDGLIGLIPGIGDAAAALLSSFIVIQAHRAGASYPVLGRMLLNLGFETLVGSIPVFGDIFDFVFKANERNVRLMQASAINERKTARRSLAIVVAGGFAIVLIVVLLIVLAWNILAALVGLLF